MIQTVVIESINGGGLFKYYFVSKFCRRVDEGLKTVIITQCSDSKWKEISLSQAVRTLIRICRIATPAIANESSQQPMHGQRVLEHLPSAIAFAVAAGVMQVMTRTKIE